MHVRFSTACGGSCNFNCLERCVVERASRVTKCDMIVFLRRESNHKGQQPAQAAPQMQKATGPTTGNLMAMADTRMVAAAPSPQAASAMAANARKQVALPQTATLADRDILLGILLILFASMSLMATRLLSSHFGSEDNSPERLNNA